MGGSGSGSVSELAAAVGRAAAVAGDDALLRAEASGIVVQFGAEVVDLLDCFLDGEAPRPPGYESASDWKNRCRQTVLAIALQSGAAGIPLLSCLAFGEYDPMQPLALAALARLASTGIEHDAICRALAHNLADLRYDALAPVLPAIADIRPVHPEVRTAIEAIAEEFEREDEVDALSALECLERCDPAAALRHEAFLRCLAQGRGVADHPPILDGAVVGEVDGKSVVEWPGGTSPPDVHSVRAALLLHRLRPSDGDIKKRLEDWMASHPDPGVREEVRRALTSGARGG